MSSSEKLLLGLFGKAGFEEFSKTLTKGEAKYGKGPMGAYVPTMVAPRAVLSWLFEKASLMKSVDEKEFKVPGAPEYSVKLMGIDNLYNAEFKKNGQLMRKYECQYFPGTCVPDANGNFSELVKHIVAACGVRSEVSTRDALKALEISKETQITASMGRLIDGLVKAEADSQESLTNKPLRGKDKEMRAEDDNSPGSDAPLNQQHEKFKDRQRMSLAEVRAESIDADLSRRHPQSEKLKQGEEAADGKKQAGSIPKLPEAAKKGEMSGAPQAKSPLVAGNHPANKRGLRSLMRKDMPQPTASPSPTVGSVINYPTGASKAELTKDGPATNAQGVKDFSAGWDKKTPTQQAIADAGQSAANAVSGAWSGVKNAVGLGKSGMGVDKPAGAGIPKMPQAPKPAAMPVAGSKNPAGAAAKQSLSAAKGLSAPAKPSSTGGKKSMGFGPMPAAGMPKMGKNEPLIKPGTANIHKSEVGHFVSEEEIYTKCEHCGQPEFIATPNGPRFNPCACFMAMTKDEDGNPTHFVALRKSADGYHVSFDPSVDEDAAKVFLLTLKTRLLVKKKFGV